MFPTKAIILGLLLCVVAHAQAEIDPMADDIVDPMADSIPLEHNSQEA